MHFVFNWDFSVIHIYKQLEHCKTLELLLKFFLGKSH